MPAKTEKQAVAARIAGAIKKGLQKPKAGEASAEMAKMPMKSLKKFQHTKDKKQKNENMGVASMYVVQEARPDMKEADLVMEFNPLEGIQGLNIGMADVHSVYTTAEEAQAIAAENYKKCMDEAFQLEEKKGKVGDKLKKTIDHLEKKRKEHVDMAKEDPKNASKHKEHIAKIATQIDDLMSKMEKIEKSKKNVEKVEDKKEDLEDKKKIKKPINENNVTNKVVKTGTYEIRMIPAGDYTNSDGQTSSFSSDKYSLYLDGQEIGDSFYAGGGIQKGFDFIKTLKTMVMGEKAIKENKKSTYTIGDKTTPNGKIYFIYNNDTGTQSGSYKTKEEAQKVLDKKEK